MPSKKSKAAGVLPLPALLVSESRVEFEALHRAVYDSIAPVDILEQIFTQDVLVLSWEILRLWRLKTATVNKTFLSALEATFTEIFQRDRDYVEASEEAEKIAGEWFTSPQVREKGLSILRRLHLDESAIEAEAFDEARSQIEALDRLLASAESRRDKALRVLAGYRTGLARHSDETSKRIIDGETLALENPPAAKTHTA